VELHRERLQPDVQVVPEGGLEVADGPGLGPAADPHQQDFTDAEAEGEQCERDQQVELAAGDRTVDDGPGDEGNGQADGDTEAGGGEHQREAPPVGPEIRSEPPEIAAAFGCSSGRGCDRRRLDRSI
jgi:hypothetical protein